LFTVLRSFFSPRLLLFFEQDSLCPARGFRCARVKGCLVRPSSVGPLSCRAFDLKQACFLWFCRFTPMHPREKTLAVLPFSFFPPVLRAAPLPVPVLILFEFKRRFFLLSPSLFSFLSPRLGFLLSLFPLVVVCPLFSFLSPPSFRAGKLLCPRPFLLKVFARPWENFRFSLRLKVFLCLPFQVVCGVLLNSSCTSCFSQGSFVFRSPPKFGLPPLFFPRFPLTAG